MTSSGSTDSWQRLRAETSKGSINLNVRVAKPDIVVGGDRVLIVNNTETWVRALRGPDVDATALIEHQNADVVELIQGEVGTIDGFRIRENQTTVIYPALDGKVSRTGPKSRPWYRQQTRSRW